MISSRALLFICIFGCITFCTKVAIIGSGVGGSSLSYYLSKGVSKCSDVAPTVTIYEKNSRTGGRAHKIVLAGREVQVGPSLVVSFEKTLVSLLQDLNISHSEPEQTTLATTLPEFGVWNGTGFLIYVDKRLTPTQLISYLAEIGIFGAAELLLDSELLLDKVADSYEKIDTFKTMEEWLDPYSMASYVAKSTESFLDSTIASTELKQLLQAAFRGTYMQQLTNLNSWLGVAATGSALETKMSIDPPTVVTKLLELAKAEVKLSTEVTEIAKTSSGYQVIDSKGGKDIFDAVVIAAPMEQAKIKFTDITMPKVIQRNFTALYLYVVNGLLNPKFFGLTTPEEVAEVDILTIKEAGFTWAYTNYEGTTKNGLINRRVFAYKPLSNETLHQMFSTINEMQLIEVPYAFCGLEPTTTFQPIILAENLYNVNAMESVVTSMGGSVHSANNIAKLILAKSNEACQ